MTDFAYLKIKAVLCLLLLTVFTSYARRPGGTDIGTSLDWLCYDADLIVTGRLTSTAHNKNADPLTDYQCENRLSITSILKGSVNTTSIRFTSRLETLGGYPLEKMVDTEVLLFLKVQHGHFHAWYDGYSLVLLQKPAGNVITGDFRMLQKKEEIISYIESTLEKLKDKTANAYYLEVPYQTEAYTALYSESTPFLIVPDVLYPSAKKSFIEFFQEPGQ